MGSLCEAGNTQLKVLKLIKAKGYRIRFSFDKTHDSAFFSAFKGEDMLGAHSVEGLFGIIYLWETYGEDWRNIDTHGVDFDEYEESQQDDEGDTSTITDSDGNTRTESWNLEDAPDEGEQPPLYSTLHSRMP